MGDANSFLNKIFLGEVASVHNYGAFVKVPGTKLQGLVHRTQVSKSEVDDVTEVLQKNDKVWCKAIKITDDGKLSLSMKVVNQGSGTDLDPNGVQTHQDEQRRLTRPTGGGRKKIELDAVYNINCTKCGTRGHMAKDCFKDPSGKIYELLPDEDESDKVIKSSEPKAIPIISQKKDKKRKKEKKKKTKKRKRGESSSSSSSSDSSKDRSDKMYDLLLDEDKYVAKSNETKSNKVISEKEDKKRKKEKKIKRKRRERSVSSSFSSSSDLSKDRSGKIYESLPNKDESEKVRENNERNSIRITSEKKDKKRNKEKKTNRKKKKRSASSSSLSSSDSSKYSKSQRKRKYRTRSRSPPHKRKK